MQLARIGERDKERPVILTGASSKHFYEAPTSVTDFNEAFFANGGMQELSRRFAAEASGWTVHQIEDGMRIGSPIARPPNFYCIGLNYRDHIAEIYGEKAAEEIVKVEKNGPEVFSKATSALCGPNDPFILPPGAIDISKPDWEVELGVVIAKKCFNIGDTEIDDCIAGYVAVNDGSARGPQMQGSQWVKGKGFPSFGAVGPWLVTPEQVDPANLNLWLKLNGVTVQNSNTSQMIWSAKQLVQYLSLYVQLLPGDIISTGTPPGVGHGRKNAVGDKDPVYLKAGDLIEMEVQGLGIRRQAVIAGL